MHQRFPAGSGAFVMATGIVSVTLAIDGAETLSRVLLAIAAGAWFVLGAQAVAGRHGLSAPASLTGVAGTAVIGARLALLGWTAAAAVAMVLTFALWIRLLPLSRGPAVGADFLAAVATESLATLAAFVATSSGARWLVAVALVPFLVGVALYVDVLIRFDFGELTDGYGDQWVAGGALAIATLACAKIDGTAQSVGPHVVHTMLRPASFVLWAAAILWVPLLLAGELRHPRRGYDVRRWATVFPVGMLGACSFLVAGATRVGAIGTFARIWTWVAFAVWVVVAAAMTARGIGLYDPQR